MCTFGDGRSGTWQGRSGHPIVPDRCAAGGLLVDGRHTPFQDAGHRPQVPGTDLGPDG